MGKKVKIIASIVGMLLILVVFFLINSNTRNINESEETIREAFRNLEVFYSTGGGSATSTISDFLDSDHFSDSIDMIIDFSMLIENISTDDLNFMQRRNLDVYKQEIYHNLGEIFSKTDNLTVRVVMIDEEVFLDHIPDALREMRVFPIAAREFLRTDTKNFILESDYLRLYASSDFFFDDNPDGVRINVVDDEDAILHFELDDSDKDNIKIHMLLDANIERTIEKPGKSILVRIPLSLDFMWDENNNLRYDAVEYIGITSDAVTGSGILPRSFVDGYFLNVSINRTGSYRLINTGHSLVGSASFEDKQNFLRVRGIELTPTEHDVITRSDFYRALMRIHWVEGLKFKGNVEPFPDVHNDPELTLMLNVARNLGVLNGFPPVRPGGSNPFRPDEPLLRKHLFVMLDSYITVFDINARNLIPTDFDAKWDLDSGLYWHNVDIDDEYWFSALNDLKNIGFMPYRNIDGVNYIAWDEPATLEECLYVLYKLVTALDFRD